VKDLEPKDLSFAIRWKVVEPARNNAEERRGESGAARFELGNPSRYDTPADTISLSLRVRGMDAYPPDVRLYCAGAG